MNSNREFQLKIINRPYLTRTVMKQETEKNTWYIEYSSWYE